MKSWKYILTVFPYITETPLKLSREYFHSITWLLSFSSVGWHPVTWDEARQECVPSMLAMCSGTPTLPAPPRSVLPLPSWSLPPPLQTERRASEIRSDMPGPVDARWHGIHLSGAPNPWYAWHVTAAVQPPHFRPPIRKAFNSLRDLPSLLFYIALTVSRVVFLPWSTSILFVWESD